MHSQSQKAAISLARLIGSKIIDDSDLLEQYAIDKSHCAPAMPDFVVRAQSERDVIHTLAVALEHRIPVVARGAGTGKSGGAIPIDGGIVLEMTALNQIVDIDRENMLAVVEPGVITGEFCTVVEKEGLFYPPDPNSLDTCTLGGNWAHNAGGPRAFKYGVTKEYVKALRTVIMGGDILNSGVRTVKGVAGYDLTSLFVGSEGTLGVFTQGTVRLIKNPAHIVTLMIPMASEAQASKAISTIINTGLVPRVMEFLDAVVVGVLRKKNISGIDDATHAVLLIEMDGNDEDRLDEEVGQLAEICEQEGALNVLMARHGAERERLWEARRLMSDALAETMRHKVSEDIVVPRSKAPAFITELKNLGKKYNVTAACYGHGGDGNYHVNILWNDDDFNSDLIVEDVFRLTINAGGTITGEHGVGVSKKPYLPWEQSAEMINWQKQIKDLFDPHHLLNPHKIFL